MRSFFLKISNFSFLCLLTFICVFLLEDGRADAYYRKFTTSKKHSLILGNSKGGQGLIPSEIDKILDGKYQGELYNFCFTLYSSPYGPDYLDVVKKKLDENTNHGLFILTVDPWSISALERDPENPILFDEKKLFMPDMKFADLNPNFFYLYKHYQKSFYEILIQRFRPGTIKLHEDGWLESEDISNPVVVKKWTESKIEFYSDYGSERTKSSIRMEYLSKTIDFLKQKGDVFLIRLPVDEEMEKLENSYLEEFNEIMLELANEKDVYFKDFNFERDELFFEDGLHLDTKSSKKLSENLGEWISRIN